VKTSRLGAWVLFATALLLVVAWPPDEGRSLIVKGVNWIVDPSDTLPILPPQLGFGLSDDPQAVEIRDDLVRRYDQAYRTDSLTRQRLLLKVAEDPLDRTTERQLLLIIGVVVAFAVWRRGARE